MKVLVTGSEGFIGRHVVQLLNSQGNQVLGICFHNKSTTKKTEYGLIQCDLKTDIAVLAKSIEQFSPDIVLHLAGKSPGSQNLNQDWDIIENNLLTTLNLLNVCNYSFPEVTIVVVSSSAVYGRYSEKELPLDENTTPIPLNTYGVSKLAVEQLALQHHRVYGQKIIVVRPFNITGPGEHPFFVTSAFARQLARIEAGKQESVVHVGNIDSVRDMTDVRDAATALVNLANVGNPGEIYNLCSGRGISMQSILDLLLSFSEKQGSITVLEDFRLKRTAEVTKQVGSPSKLEKAIDWKRRYTIRETLRDVLDFWRTETSTGLA